jgi:hypothetical protein
VVSLPSGQQVVNTSRPADVDLPFSNVAGLPPRVVREGKPDVSDLFLGPATKRLNIAITVPAVREGRVTHVLHLGLLSEDLAPLLARHLPAGWFVSLVDSHHRIITRAPFDPSLIGETPPDWYRSATTSSSDTELVRGRH